ncbi:putative deoxyribonuclease TATDN1 [Zerene cesonia]|uniref:putative deoxyribonuclease TATDN1 n=1 Tax=Zerene cesonia TaxID=33412 RepID=UPI0018E4E3E3|nr:putative deoxyribonuclease TATDN1 [Zerene cesonia]
MRKMTNMKKFIDIGANLTDDMYQGVYHGSKKHEPDLNNILDRAWSGGMCKMIITGGNLADSRKALELARTDSRLFSTVGCHPTRCNDFLPDPEKYLKDLSDLITENKDKVVAIGEFGLDYDRLNFCDKETQLKYFELQLKLCNEHKLPLFLHCRAATDDLVGILGKHRDSVAGGVVHSFDGSYDCLQKILELGMHIGINGCSLRTAENLEVASKIPQDKLLIETDCPWCEIKQTHPSFKHVTTKFATVKKEKYSPESDNQVKGRNEPVNIIQVLEVLAAVRGEDIDQLAQAIFENTERLFFSNK